MTRDRKSARLYVGCFQPQRAVYEPMEPREDVQRKNWKNEVGEEVHSSPTPIAQSPARVEAIDLTNDDEDEVLQPLPRIGWTDKLSIKKPDDNAFYHDLLTMMLECYYPDLQATLEYHTTEHSHPLIGSSWDTRLLIKTPNIRKIDAVVTHHVSRATAERSMEDAASIALAYYRGRLSDDKKDDGLLYYPCYLPKENSWTIEVVVKGSKTLEATVELNRELTNKVGALKGELKKAQDMIKEYQKEIDGLNAELGHPKLFEKLDEPSTKKNAAP